jgi:hypothetical protein
MAMLGTGRDFGYVTFTRVWRDANLVFPNRMGGPMDHYNIYYRDYKPLLKRAAALPVTAVVDQMFGRVVAKGRGGRDYSAIMDLIEEWSMRSGSRTAGRDCRPTAHAKVPAYPVRNPAASSEGSGLEKRYPWP